MYSRPKTRNSETNSYTARLYKQWKLPSYYVIKDSMTLDGKTLFSRIKNITNGHTRKLCVIQLTMFGDFLLTRAKGWESLKETRELVSIFCVLESE